jgi:hypothetical protein
VSNNNYMSRADAKRRHPSSYGNLQRIFGPEDFDAAVRDAEAIVKAGNRRLIVNDYEYLSPAVLFTRSRERRARLYDRLAVALLLMLCAALGCIAVILATPAKAAPDVDNVVFAYANTYGPAVCETLADGHDTLDGLTGILMSITGDGLTPFQAGQVVAISVGDGCPEYAPLLRAFVARSGATAA